MRTKGKGKRNPALSAVEDPLSSIENQKPSLEKGTNKSLPPSNQKDSMSIGIKRKQLEDITNITPHRVMKRKGNTANGQALQNHEDHLQPLPLQESLITPTKQPLTEQSPLSNISCVNPSPRIFDQRRGITRNLISGFLSSNINQVRTIQARMVRKVLMSSKRQSVSPLSCISNLSKTQIKNTEPLPFMQSLDTPMSNAQIRGHTKLSNSPSTNDVQLPLMQSLDTPLSLTNVRTFDHILPETTGVHSPGTEHQNEIDSDGDYSESSHLASENKGYQDDGDPTFVCVHCGALLWFGERIGKSRKTKTPIFSLCCMQGKVILPETKPPPEYLIYLLTSNDDIAKHFRENIRAFNMMFSFTSLGGKVNYSINIGRGPCIFQLHGENYHLMGSLQPEPSNQAKFGQLYIHDTENEINNRLAAYGSKSAGVNSQNLRSDLVEGLMKMLDAFNPLCQAWRMAKDKFAVCNEEKVYLQLIAKRGKDGRTHNTPTCSEIAALIVGDLDMNMDKRDIVIEDKAGRLQRICELHPSYLPLQYPLLFPYGEDGFRLGIGTANCEVSERKRKTITMREWFAYRIQDRGLQFPNILHSKRLFQQFLVDGFTMVESDRLQYLKKNQQSLRSENYQALQNAKDNGDTNNGTKQGKKVILPASFVGGQRYMLQNYMDAMTICKYYGFPDLFITFTCNPKWPEITRYLEKHGLKSEDRPDVLCRIFKIKLDCLMDDITKKELFGKVVSAMYTVEFQKRGLPHAHILLFMHKDFKFPTADDIDRIISAEIPDKTKDPELYNAVKDLMIHGPCGLVNTKSPCMVDGMCSKYFPKNFTDTTILDEEGYPVYRRRDDGRFVEKSGLKVDNRYVVPYNRDLLLRYRAHINIEWCNQSRSIKYLFKYINKGQDRVTATINKKNTTKDGEVDRNEIRDYYDCRYVSACEATWRILAFGIHHRTTPVQKLSFHLENEQRIMFDDDDDIDEILNDDSVHETMFLSWMECNKIYPLAKTITYAEFPKYFVWNQKTKKWTPRKKGFSIGRINHVPIKLKELYYLRILLNICKGPTSYAEIRTVNDVEHPSFRDACYALGLMDDDAEYIEGIKDASFYGSAFFMRRLFAHMLLSESVSKPEDVWEETWHILSEDILHKRRQILRAPRLTLDEEQIKNFALEEIEKILRSNGSSLKFFPEMPLPAEGCNENNLNRLIIDEESYPRAKLAEEFNTNFGKLTDEQSVVYHEVMDAVTKENGGVFFVYGFGGTGKTFVWKMIAASLRSKGEIVLNVASSGIAALLLDGGRTAHSRFGIPIKVDEFTTCSMTANSDLAALVAKAKLIIWDEAPMMSKHCFETLDRTLVDIVGKPGEYIPFGGKVVVFGGDFRQILPVINRGSRQDIVLATLTSSLIWDHCKILKLTKNMRLLTESKAEEAEEVRNFAEWILDIGDGKINEPNTGEVEIDIPEELLICDSDDPIEELVQTVYGDPNARLNEPKFFQERAILCPTNEDVDMINNYMLSKLPGNERTYLSSDSICPSEKNYHSCIVYSPEYLNSLKISGLPNHQLNLKIGAPVMLLRNIDPKNGLCNGTRLQITVLTDHIIQAIIITGDDFIGKTVFLPRMLISPSDTKLPFKMRRRQFPISVAFAMTINKSQGQTLKNVGLYLPRPVFSHGQLYVALSRVKSKKGLKILILDKNGKPSKKTLNVVFKEIYQKIV